MVKDPRETLRSLDRRATVAKLLADRRGLLVVTGLGSPTWDVAALGDDERNFYLWGAMGLATMTGLGLALARPNDDVAVITGDGELLMGLGSLATTGVQAPKNLSVVVLDNERYGETGMQASHTAFGVDLAGVARASGFKVAREVRDEAGLAEIARLLRAKAGPVFANVKVKAEDVPRVLPPRDGALLKDRFRAAVLGAEKRMRR